MTKVCTCGDVPKNTFKVYMIAKAHGSSNELLPSLVACRYSRQCDEVQYASASQLKDAKEAHALKEADA